jgi:hypothetical protein
VTASASAPAGARAFASDEEAACAFVQAVETAVAALQSIRSRLGGKRDATAATGHMLEALLMAGGSLRDYDRSKIWAMRHAIGGESFAFKSEFDAAVTVLASVAHGLRPPVSAEEDARKQTARAEIEAIAQRLMQCDNAIESTRALDDWERGMVAAKAVSDKAAHEARLAGGFKGASSPPPKPPSAPPKAGRKTSARGEPAIEGDFPLPGGVEAGADPFPTQKVG